MTGLRLVHLSMRKLQKAICVSVPSAGTEKTETVFSNA